MTLSHLVFLSLLHPVFISAQVWTQTGAPSVNWTGLAASADGAKLFATANGLPATGIYCSTNSGASWTTNSAPSAPWQGVACSADGTKLAAISVPAQGVPGSAPGGSIFLSTNAGASWQKAAVPSNTWASITVSADGLKLAAICTYISANSPSLVYGKLFISTDGGEHWITNFFPQGGWRSVALSADGGFLAGISSGGVFISTNSGATWVSNRVAPNAGTWQSVSTSADGTWLMALGTSRGFGYAVAIVSTNSGMTWCSNNPPIQASSLGGAVSADGSKLLAGGVDQFIVSTNYGASWSGYGWSNSWSRYSSVNTSIAVSADGKSLFAAVADNGLVPQSSWGAIYSLHFPASPVLHLAPTPGSLTLAWAIPSANFILQQSDDLVSWADATDAPVLNTTSLQNEVSLQAAGTNAFYRLKAP